jgi:DNA-binding PadR family transcriptional regulator
MNEHELLLLGLLVNQSQHGYQLNEFIERDLAHLTNMKKGNAYATLGRLEKEGFVKVVITQEGNRPQRKVYSITPGGEKKFVELLRNNLSNSERMVFAGDVGLMFLDHLGREEVIECLTGRLTQVKAKLAEHAGAPMHGHGIGVDLALQHVLHMQRAEVSWLEEVLEKLQGQV